MKTEKSIVITGVSRGLGLALSREFVRRGYHVVGVSRQLSSDFEDLVQSNSATFLPCDLGVEDDRSLLTSELLDSGSQFCAVIFNAGITAKREIGDFSYVEMRDVIDVNLVSVMALSQSLMGATQNMVFVSSIAGKWTEAGYGVYAASKHGLEGWVKTLAKEWQGKVYLFRPFRLRTRFSDAGLETTSPVEHKLPVGWYASYMVARMLGERARTFYWWVRCWGWWVLNAKVKSKKC